MWFYLPKCPNFFPRIAFSLKRPLNYQQQQENQAQPNLGNDQFMAMSGLSIWLQHHHHCSSSPLPLLVQNPLHAQIECVQGKLQIILNGFLMATLFYEALTRTRLSFESTMKRLGGEVLTTENAREFSSTAKGETLESSFSNA
ncbi:hypothetical protein LOK49_LG05G03898 [Camellia lanceoleosa]|uniref:Uncharacterized protein n=1 Tax=Camellia lanceoleosa TaxID=1840588 RepID=A0ACC0HS14_9ERIC|nr:hypothetical protein LOK49_LG05G03898 [Camellia lanceoleosa]